MARQGFSYQDQVAAILCLDLILEPALQEVWCEDQDDLTLLWRTESTITVEFVQVKSAELDQLWTVAKACERRKVAGAGDGKPKASKPCLVEHFLRLDRCTEATRFRVVTSRDVDLGLRPLVTLAIGSARGESGDFLKLQTDLRARLADVKSVKQNGADYWAENTRWEVRPEGTMQDALMMKILTAADRQGEHLTQEQAASVCLRLLQLVKEAAEAPHAPGGSAKRIRKAEFRTWWLRLLMEIAHAFGEAGMTLREKMVAAKIPVDAIPAAYDLRMVYRSETLLPAYEDAGGVGRVFEDVSAILNSLRAKLDSGELADDGPAFHNRCLQEIAARAALDKQGVANREAVIQGCMYDIADRCRHRFVRGQA